MSALCIIAHIACIIQYCLKQQWCSCTSMHNVVLLFYILQHLGVWCCMLDVWTNNFNDICKQHAHDCWCMCCVPVISLVWMSIAYNAIIPNRKSTLHYTTLHYTTLHCTALHCTALHCTALHCTALHYTTLHCTALHCTALHYTTLHYTTLQQFACRDNGNGFSITWFCCIVIGYLPN